MTPRLDRRKHAKEYLTEISAMLKDPSAYFVFSSGPRPWAFVIPSNKTVPDFGEGRCRSCGRKIVWPRRFYCCDLCYTDYHDAVDGTYITWTSVRLNVTWRDEEMCVRCKAKHPLEVHHIIPYHQGGNFLEPSNLVTLCEGCHRRAHSELK